MRSLILKKKRRGKKREKVKKKEKEKSGWRCVKLGGRSLAREAADGRLPVNWHRQGKFGTSTDIFLPCNLRGGRLGRQRGEKGFRPRPLSPFQPASGAGVEEVSPFSPRLIV